MGDAIIIAAFGCFLAVWALLRMLAAERQRRMDELRWRLDREAEEDNKAAERAGKPRQGARKAA